jgi:hypothetical protein
MSGSLSATAWIGVDANSDHVSYKCHVLPLTFFSPPPLNGQWPNSMLCLLMPFLRFPAQQVKGLFFICSHMGKFSELS